MARLRKVSLSRAAPWIVGVTIAAVAAGALISTSQSSITRARLERNLPQTFANRYVAQAELLGHTGVSVSSMKPRAQCYKGVPNVADQGSGAGVWLCYMRWHDPNVDETLMPGKFELNVHSNSCYTATGPSKLLGLLTITDKSGKDVVNPVAEFDSCFDPHGPNTPTGNVDLVPTKTSPTGPANLTIATTALRPDAAGVIRPLLTCSQGQEGCGGTIVATAGGTRVGTATYALAPGTKGTVALSLASPVGRAVVLAPTPVIGAATAAKVVVPVRAS